MRILAIDAASKTGWACFNGTLQESGVQDFTKRRGETNGLMFLKFRKWLVGMVDLWKPEVIAYEQAHHRGGAATEICVNLTGRVQEVCADRGITPYPIHSLTLKKWATGSGRAEKPQMMAVAIWYLGRMPVDDNEADAALLGAYANEEV